MQSELLEPVEESTSLALLPRADSASIFDGFLEKAKTVAEAAERIKVTDIADTTGPKMARAARLDMRAIRTTTENRRKEMVEGMTAETRRINALAKQVKDYCEEREAELLELELFADRENARLEGLRRTERTEMIRPYLTGPLSIDVALCAPDEWERLLADQKDLFELRQKRQREEEEARIAKEKADAEERERLRQENERLQTEAAENARLAEEERKRAEEARLIQEQEARREREAAEAQRRAIEEESRREREAAAKREAAAAEERRQLEEKGRRLEAEAKRQAQQAQEALEAAARRERQLKEDAEAAERRRENEARLAQQEAERKERQAKADAEAAERRRIEEEAAAAAEKERQEQERISREQTAPDKEKLRAWVASFKALPLPLLSAGSSRIQQDLLLRINALAQWTETQANNI